jgi:catechol 2,3-dioxygenase-like lactoylglutathione lyase family enzyme
MAGIVFLRTKNLEEITEFYKDKLDMKTWVEQPDIEILQHENFLIGFHQQDESDCDSLLTFFYSTTEEVDIMYGELREHATTEPKINGKYKIYNFFAKDPEGRTIEVQCFLHKLKPINVDWIK